MMVESKLWEIETPFRLKMKTLIQRGIGVGFCLVWALFAVRIRVVRLDQMTS